MNIIKQKILIIDDVAENLNILRQILRSQGYELFLAKDGSKGFEIAKEIKPDLILLDIMMPILNGYETCKLLKEDKNLKEIPVIFLSALSESKDKVKAFEVGGVDYIAKPFNDQEVLVRVKSHLQTSSIIASLNNLIERSFHEIYTPLGVIQTGLEMQVLEHGESEYLDSIKSATRILNVVSDDIYYAIKKEVASFEPMWIELEPFLQNQIKYLNPYALTKNINFEFKCNMDNPMIYINEMELKRVCLNILSNAIKYSHEHTKIKVEIKELGEYIEFSFENQGKVIKDINKIFSKLYQENSDKLGLGIGLDIVSQVCKKNNIKIDVTSLNNFTKFIFTYKEKI